MYVQGLEADLNEKNHINTVGFILQIINELMYWNWGLIRIGFKKFKKRFVNYGIRPCNDFWLIIINTIRNNLIVVTKYGITVDRTPV